MCRCASQRVVPGRQTRLTDRRRGASPRRLASVIEPDRLDPTDRRTVRNGVATTRVVAVELQAVEVGACRLGRARPTGARAATSREASSPRQLIGTRRPWGQARTGAPRSPGLECGLGTFCAVSSANRQRRQQNRTARTAAVEQARRRAQRRRLTFAAVGLVLALVVAIVLVARARDNSGSSASTTTATSTSSASTSSVSTTSGPTTTVAGSVAGKPCVAMSGPLPAGAPAVPVKVGPPPTHLVKQDLKVGTGAVVKPDATVTVNYIGVSCSTGKIFDSSYSRHQSFTTPLAEVVPGWTQGIPGMRVGGERLLGIPPALAYGTRSPGSGIAPDENPLVRRPSVEDRLSPVPSVSPSRGDGTGWRPRLVRRARDPGGVENVARIATPRRPSRHRDDGFDAQHQPAVPSGRVARMREGSRSTRRGHGFAADLASRGPGAARPTRSAWPVSLPLRPRPRHRTRPRHPTRRRRRTHRDRCWGRYWWPRSTCRRCSRFPQR